MDDAEAAAKKSASAKKGAQTRAKREWASARHCYGIASNNALARILKGGHVDDDYDNDHVIAWLCYEGLAEIATVDELLAIARHALANMDGGE